MGGSVAGQVFEGALRFDIVVRLPGGLRQDRESLASLPIALPEKQRDLPGASASEVPSPTHVPLGEVATIEVALGPNQISRENGKRRGVVTANVRDRDLGSFGEASGEHVAPEVELPPGSWVDYGGPFGPLHPPTQQRDRV